MTITYTINNNLYVNITNRCPNKCEFCLRNNKSGIGDAESLWLEREPRKEEILDDILKWNLDEFDEIVFCGYGEPTCRIEDMLFVCKQIRKISDIKIRVNTNGLSDLINSRQTAKEFKDLVDTVSISLNASNKENYDNICHSEFGLRAFDAIISFAVDSKKYIPDVFMSVVDTNDNLGEINKCKEICKNMGLSLKVRKFIK